MYRGLWGLCLSGCCGSLAEHWLHKPAWVRFQATISLLTFPYFTSKYLKKLLYFMKQVLNRTIIGSYSSRKTCIHSHGSIGACRAVWVPGQDLAHLMRNCGKLFRHYTIRYTRTSVCAYAIEGGMPRVFASGPLDESTHASK